MGFFVYGACVVATPQIPSIYPGYLCIMIAQKILGLGFIMQSPLLADYVHKNSMGTVVGTIGVILEFVAILCTTLPTYLASKYEIPISMFYLVIGGIVVIGALPLIVGIKEMKKKSKIVDFETIDIEDEKLTMKQKCRLILKGACSDLMKEKRIWFAIGGNICSAVSQICCGQYGALIYSN